MGGRGRAGGEEEEEAEEVVINRMVEVTGLEEVVSEVVVVFLQISWCCG